MKWTDAPFSSETTVVEGVDALTPRMWFEKLQSGAGQILNATPRVKRRLQLATSLGVFMDPKFGI